MKPGRDGYPSVNRDLSYLLNWYKIFVQLSRCTITASLPLNRSFSCARDVKGKDL
jgi:hypothetical protein